MSDQGRKSKIFVVVISVVVIALIIIGCILTWKIIQRGQENSEQAFEVVLSQINETVSHQEFH